MARKEMNFKAILGPFKNIWQVIGAMFILNTGFLYFFWPNSYSDLKSFLIANIWGTVIWVTQGVGNSAVFHFLDTKLPWRDGMLVRAIANIAGIAIYSTVAYLLVQVTMYSIFYPSVSLTEMWESSIQSTVITLMISFSISFILTFIGFGKSMIANEVEKERLQTEMFRYKYNSLRNQINPHFLFNSFNVLTELVYENQKLAEKFIHQLSDLYRYVLDSKDLDIIELHKEIAFLKSFTFLLKTRFEERVVFDIQFESEPKEMIIPMSLQMLVENCIKHNSATTKNPLKIKVYKENNAMIVENNLQPKSSENSSHKVGLNNLKERYKYLSNKEVRISKDKDTFKVSIPIIFITE